jgi:N-methylhydantoinase B
LDLIARHSRVADMLAAGQLPSDLPEISDTIEPGQNYATSYLAPGEVFAMTWQGGGGYGDPLTRDPDAVAHDVREQRVSTKAARAVYGVVIEGGAVNAAATVAERDQQRARRRERSRVLGHTGGKAVLSSARRLDDNLVQAPASDGTGTVVACRHCAEILGGSGPGDTLALALYEGPPTEAGPQIIANPADYVDTPVVFRQYCCPSCWTALHSAVVPVGHVDTIMTLHRWSR